MKVVNQNAEILASTKIDEALELIYSGELEDTNESLKVLEQAGRTSYQSFGKIEKGSADRLIAAIIKSGHSSVLEHCSITVRLTTNRGVTHELVRHRVGFSFTQESTRYVNSKDMNVILPEWIFKGYRNYINDNGTRDECLNWISAPELSAESSKKDEKFDAFIDSVKIWLETMRFIETKYNEMMEKGRLKQEARGILPNDLKTEIVVTSNLRGWRNFLGLRLPKDAHPDIRLLASKIYELLESYCPLAMEDFKDLYLSAKS